MSAALFIIILIMVLVWISDVKPSEPAEKKHIRSLKIGSQVKILDGYFTGEIGVIEDYIPYNLISPAGLFQSGLVRPEQFKVKIKNNVHFFKPSSLELIGEG